MKIPINHPGFAGRELYLQTPGLLSGAQLYLDGTRVQKHKGTYLLRDNAGQETTAKLKATPFDPIPRVQIGDDTIRLAEPLKWYEYVWMCLPVGLLFVGGALGGGLGAGAAYGNALVFRSGHSTALKYVLTGLVTVVAVVLFVVIAGLFHVLLGRR